MKDIIDHELESKGLRLVIKHINSVQNHMTSAISILLERLSDHDQSKYDDDELGLVLGKPSLDKYQYMSVEERAALAAVKGAVARHYAKNSHHPEHYENGINGMSLLDLIEMACDWKAASESSSNGSFENSIRFGEERFGMSPQLVDIFMNTGRELGWIDDDE